MRTTTSTTEAALLLSLALVGACIGGEQDDGLVDRNDSALQGPKVMNQAFRQLVNAAPSPMRIEYWRRLDDVECAKLGMDDACAQVCTTTDSATSEAPECTTRPVKAAERLGDPLATGYICLEDRCVPAGVHPTAQPRTNVLGIYESAANTQGQTAEIIGNVNASPQVFGVIPPIIWDWLTGTEGQCCNDCWATHRTLGLPCAADYACCAGTCGQDPGYCGGGGGGGGTGGPGGGGGTGGGTDGQACGESYSVIDATVEIHGHDLQLHRHGEPNHDRRRLPGSRGVRA